MVLAGKASGHCPSACRGVGHLSASILPGQHHLADQGVSHIPGQAVEDSAVSQSFHNPHKGKAGPQPLRYRHIHQGWFSLEEVYQCFQKALGEFQFFGGRLLVSSQGAIPSPTMQGVLGMTKATRVSWGGISRYFHRSSPGRWEMMALPLKACNAP